MKRISLAILAILSIVMLNAQTPQGIQYQAVVRDNLGVLITNQSVSVRVSLLQGSATGTQVYTETHAITSGGYGQLNLVIGAGTVGSGTFNTIDWANGPYFVKIAVDITGGSNYTDLSTSELMSVPYALYAAKAGSADNVDDADADPANELQVLSINSDTLFISNGGFVILPSSTGPQGPTGATGIQGPTGATGTQGPAGADGATGAAGADGATGAAGADGATGAAGAPGAAGATGPAGADGATGAAGLAGADGATGATGAAGADGATGATGPQGDPATDDQTLTWNGGSNELSISGGNTVLLPISGGSVGPTGATGPIGPIGVTGADGATGPTGADGADGATGAAGTDGATGATGPAGADGAIGATGPTGATGADGADGATGVAGADGATGATGAQGDPATDDQTLTWNGGTNELTISGGNTVVLPISGGSVGPTGAAGADGATGPTGPAGADGAPGATGADGVAGATGADGADGATGPTGAAGADGATGATGPAGADGAAGTDAQQLTFTNYTLTIDNGNSVLLDTLQDNLGNHVATQNLETNGNWISNDGDNEGLFVDGTSGYVGLNTTSPDVDFHIKNDNAVGLIGLKIESTNSANVAVISFANDAGVEPILGLTSSLGPITPNLFALLQTTADPVAIITDNTPRIFVEGTGNVGIGGITSADATLHVDGDFKLVDGTEANNYVLTSDADGLASWKPAATNSTAWAAWAPTYTAASGVETINSAQYKTEGGDIAFIELDAVVETLLVDVSYMEFTLPETPAGNASYNVTVLVSGVPVAATAYRSGNNVRVALIGSDFLTNGIYTVIVSGSYRY